MKKVLVPIDFSGDSINALEHAIAIANKIDADIRMIFVKKSKNFEAPLYFKGLDSFQGKTINEYFDRLVDKYKSQVKNRFDYKIREGKVYKEITNQAKYDDSYLIVLGTHGISGFEELWIGSNAFRVVSNAECPVITVRYGFSRKEVFKIVMPIDITSESRKKVPLVAELATLFDAEVHVVSVSETNASDIQTKLEQYATQVIDYLKERNIKVQHEALLENNITDMTIEYAIRVDADLIAIMTEQSENPLNIWLGPYAQQMVNHSPIPVLSVHVK